MMKKYFIYILSVVCGCLLLFSMTSCIHEGDLDLAAVPDIGFTYTSNGLTLTFTSATAEATNLTWKVSDGGTGSGDEFVHKFEKTGHILGPDDWNIQWKRADLRYQGFGRQTCQCKYDRQYL
jgi:hypothetical protein